MSFNAKISKCNVFHNCLFDVADVLKEFFIKYFKITSLNIQINRKTTPHSVLKE